MWSIKDLIEKIKRYFTGGKIEKSGERPTIRIRERHEINSPSHPALESTPKIKVRAIHRNDSAAGETDIVNRVLGKGIVVNECRKPGRCPICATRGKIVVNMSGDDSWMCEECGSTFN